MSVTITVPEEITARLVIATDQVSADVPMAIRQGLPASFAMALAERLGTPRLEITGHRTADSPWDLSEVAATDEVDTTMIRHASHHVGITSVLPVNDLPLGLVLARAAAKTIAESIRGVPVDIDSGQVLAPTSFGRLDEFILADEWLGASLPLCRNACLCPAGEDDIDGCACVDLTTRGLPRLGVPELEITDVACRHDLAALNILRTTAQRLLPIGRVPGTHVLPSEIGLTSDDFSAFWGHREPIWDDGPISVRLSQTGTNRLGIRPPEDFPGTLNEWLWDELPPILHEFLSCEPDAAHPHC